MVCDKEFILVQNTELSLISTQHGLCYAVRTTFKIRTVSHPSGNSWRRKKTAKKNNSDAALGFEATLWAAADKLRNNLDAAEYKHVVLGLNFLKYISDAFTELHDLLNAGEGEYEGADPEDADEYLTNNVFWVPPAARWAHLQANANPLDKITSHAAFCLAAHASGVSWQSRC